MSKGKPNRDFLILWKNKILILIQRFIPPGFKSSAASRLDKALLTFGERAIHFSNCYHMILMQPHRWSRRLTGAAQYQIRGIMLAAQVYSLRASPPQGSVPIFPMPGVRDGGTRPGPLFLTFSGAPKMDRSKQI